MNWLFWGALALVLAMLLPAALFGVLFLATGEVVPRRRAAMFGRWAVLVLLAYCNLVIFGRVFDALRDLLR
jgi:hypothetical protein